VNIQQTARPKEQEHGYDDDALAHNLGGDHGYESNDIDIMSSHEEDEEDEDHHHRDHDDDAISESSNTSCSSLSTHELFKLDPMYYRLTKFLEHDGENISKIFAGVREELAKMVRQLELLNQGITQKQQLP
jgi:hypothetical protein